ncbi:AMP-binding protein [Parapusillimonas sp. JC17]|uniref:AMP-binding protein n=1 Tax=Parapusillimonas sp. JC17 TaxID=3445768 RepID=UPI003FA0681E
MNDQYSELYSSYQWLVPSQFNIAQACVHRWAENPFEGRRIAIYHENELGQREVWTYSRLAETCGKLANGLLKMGVQPGDRVAVTMEQRPELAAAHMAILSIGAITTPLSGYPYDHLTACLNDADIRVAITDADSAPGLLGAQARRPALTQIVGLDLDHEAVIPWRTLLARQMPDLKLVSTRPATPALLFYGQPDTQALGTLLPHGALIGSLPGFVASQNWLPQKGDIFWTPSAWSTHAGLALGILPALYFGLPVLSVAGYVSAQRALELLERYQVTNVHFPAALLADIMGHTPSPRQQHQLALRAVASHDGQLDQPARDWCANALGCPVNQTLSRNEASYLLGDSYRKWPPMAGSIGKPYPGHRIAVLDSLGRPCATGKRGEIALHRYDQYGHPDPSLFLGYWGNDAAGQARFRGDWFLTGVRAWIDDNGYYWPAES